MREQEKLKGLDQ